MILFGMVSVFSRLSRHLAILLPIFECVLSHFVACVQSTLQLGLLIGWDLAEPFQSHGPIPVMKWPKIHSPRGERMTR